MEEVVNKQEHKPCLSVVAIGHVDVGKSTALGHLLKEVKQISDDEYKEIYKLSTQFGRNHYSFTWILDTLKPERERGITVRNKTRFIELKDRTIAVTDTPGHREFGKKAIKALCLADIAILFVPGPENHYSCMIQDGTTFDYAKCAFHLGVDRLIVAVTQMDRQGASYSEEQFLTVKNKVEEGLEKIGYNRGNLEFVPISGIRADNLATQSNKMEWYKGKPLFEILKISKIKEKKIDQPLRFLVNRVYKMKGYGTVVTGKVQFGSLKKGQIIKILPLDKEAEIRYIKKDKNMISEAFAGEYIGLNIPSISHREIRKDSVISDPKNFPSEFTKKFTAEITILEHPKLIFSGYTPILTCGSTCAPCKIKSIISKKIMKNGIWENEKFPAFIKNGDSATIEFEPTIPVFFEAFKEYPELGRFVMRDFNKIVGFGKIIKIEKEKSLD